MVKIVYRFMRRGFKKMTGREPAHGSGIEPVEIWAHQPKMMSGMGKFQQAVRKGNTVDKRLKYLVELKGAQMIGCEFASTSDRRSAATPASPTTSFWPCPTTAPASCSPSGKSWPWTTPLQ
jgi:hypothetical protein